MMRFNRQRLGQWLLCLCLLSSIGHLDAQLREVLNRANLVTVSALTDVHTELVDSINRIPQLLFQVATLIDEQGETISRRVSDNTLVNPIEKFSLVARGIFRTPNTLGVNSYEIAVTETSTLGRLALYSDDNFQFSSIMLRWRNVKHGSHFTLKRFMSSHVKEETLWLASDGSGCYRVTLDKAPVLFLKWDASGHLTTPPCE